MEDGGGARRLRVSLQYPRNWDRLSDEEKMAVARGMASELPRALRPATDTAEREGDVPETAALARAVKNLAE